MAKLIIKEGDRKRIYDICEDVLHIGSTPENNIRLRDQKISRVHCEIKKTPRGYRILDLESKHGTKVNGQFINQHDLRHGDKIQVGGALLQFNAGSAAARAAIEPRDSMRMERARSKKGLPAPAIVAIGLAVVAVVVIIIAQIGSMKQLEGLTMMDRVGKLSNSTERPVLEKARKLLVQYEKLPAKEKNPTSDYRYEKYLKKVKDQIEVLAEAEHYAHAKDDYFRMSNIAYTLVKGGDYSQAIALVDSFCEKYPDSAYTKPMQVKKAKWIRKLKGEMENFPTTLKAINEHIDNERYREARHLVRVARTLVRKDENVKALNAADKRLQVEMDSKWKDRHREAQEYADVGNFRVPRDIYTKIKRNWGVPKYVKLAEAELEKIKMME